MSERKINKVNNKGKHLPREKITIKKARTNDRKKRKGSFHVVCIGASAGGLNAVSELLSQLDAQLNAAFFVVLHFSGSALGDILEDRLKRNTSLPCSLAKMNEPIKAGHIYIAAPGAHLLLKKDHIILGQGPPENRFPSFYRCFVSVCCNKLWTFCSRRCAHRHAQ